MAPSQSPSLATEPSSSSTSAPPVVRKDEVTLPTPRRSDPVRPHVQSSSLFQIEEEPKISEVEGAEASAAVVDASLADLVKADEDKEEQKDGKKKKNRCASCNKKVGLTGKHLNLLHKQCPIPTPKPVSSCQSQSLKDASRDTFCCSLIKKPARMTSKSDEAPPDLPRVSFQVSVVDVADYFVLSIVTVINTSAHLTTSKWGQTK
jgi:hypothetical protein